jgi:hypothetical protein
MVEVQPSATADGSDKSRLLADVNQPASGAGCTRGGASGASETYGRPPGYDCATQRAMFTPAESRRNLCGVNPGLRYRLPWAILFRLLRRLSEKQPQGGGIFIVARHISFPL